jgi:hypothetical protein
LNPYCASGDRGIAHLAIISISILLRYRITLLVRKDHPNVEAFANALNATLINVEDELGG